MRIALDSVPEHGITAELSLRHPWARGAAVHALGVPPDTLEGELVVTRLADGLRVKGHVSTSARLLCARCGEDVVLRLHGDVDLFYAPAGDRLPTHGGDDRSLAEDELDVGWFEGGALELGDALAEQLSLWTPDRVRCEDRPTSHAEVSPTEPGRPCKIAAQQPGPDLTRQSPFAKLRLPE